MSTDATLAQEMKLLSVHTIRVAEKLREGSYTLAPRALREHRYAHMFRVEALIRAAALELADTLGEDLALAWYQQTQLHVIAAVQALQEQAKGREDA